MSGIINLVRGMYVLVPRDMTRAAGFYNALLKSGDPAIVVEGPEWLPDQGADACQHR